MSELITMSSKGQIVIPKDLRKELGIDSGSNFVVFGKDDTLILKKVNVPTAKEVFEKVHKWGVAFAKTKGWKEGDVMKRVYKGRGIKSE